MTKLPRTRGRIVIVAIFAEPMMVDLRNILWREYTVVGARNYVKQDFDEAIRLVVEGNLPLDKLVSDVRPVDEGAGDVRGYRQRQGELHEGPHRYRRSLRAGSR